MRRAASLTRSFWCFQRRDSHFQCGEAFLEIMKLRLGRLLTGPGVGGKLRHGVQFLPLHQIEPADGLVDAGTSHRLDLLAQPRERGNRTAGDTGQIVEELRPLGHGR